MFVTTPRRSDITVNQTWRREFPGSAYGGTPPQTISEDFPLSRIIRTWTDSRLTFNSPSWRSRIAEGLNATGSLIGVKQKLGITEGMVYDILHVLPNGPFWYTDKIVKRGAVVFCDAPTPQGLSDVHAYNQASQRFYSSARSAQTTFQGLVVAGEMGQTLRGIGSAANGVYRGLWNYVNALRKGNVLRTLSLLSKEGKTKFISDRWLEAVFGIKPLIADTISGAETLADILGKFRNINKRVDGYGSDELAFTSSFPTGNNLKWEVLTREKFEVIYYGSVRLDEQVAGVPDLGRFGLDSSNWLPSLWELIPYSFVADYFFNIQHILSAFAFQKSSVRWAAQTTRRTISNETMNAQISTVPPPPSLRIATPGSMLHEKIDVTRSAIDSVPIPSLEFSIPGLSTKWLNLAALFGASRRTQRLIW